MQQGQASVAALYIMAFTWEERGSPKLMEAVYVADMMLRGKDAAFKALMEGAMAPQTRVEVSSVRFEPDRHTPWSMQVTMAGWLKQRYGVTFAPRVGQNFFPHGMKDPQGRPTYILYYFDLPGAAPAGAAGCTTDTAAPTPS